MATMEACSGFGGGCCAMMWEACSEFFVLILHDRARRIYRKSGGRDALMLQANRIVVTMTHDGGSEMDT